MRVLKRPMFRKGGSTSKGIMTGLVDRKQYENGTQPYDPKQFTQAITREAGMTIPEFEQILRAYTPKTRLPIGEFGLNIASGMPITEALKSPYARFVKQDDAREAAIKTGAASTGLKFAMSKALAKAKGKDKFQKERTPERFRRDLFELFSKPPSAGQFRKDINQLNADVMSKFFAIDRPIIEGVDSFKGRSIRVFPHEISGNKAKFDANQMIAGVLYFRPDKPDSIFEKDSEKNTMIEYGKFSGKVIKEYPL